MAGRESSSWKDVRSSQANCSTNCSIYCTICSFNGFFHPHRVLVPYVKSLEINYSKGVKPRARKKPFGYRFAVYVDFVFRYKFAVT